jgi:hypothetical protein
VVDFGFCGGLKGCGDGSGAGGTLELTLHRPEFCRGIIIKLSFDTPSCLDNITNTNNNREYVYRRLATLCLLMRSRKLKMILQLVLP